MRAITKRFLYALLSLVLCVVTVFCGQVTLSAYATTDESVQATYENTNVLNNLKGATIGGKEFNLADYPHNSDGKPQVYPSSSSAIPTTPKNKRTTGFMSTFTIRRI